MAGLTITWNKMGSHFTYNVWYAMKIAGPWIKHNKELLTDDVLDKKSRDGDSDYIYSSENTYFIDGLKDNTKYFTKVTCDDRYYQWWYSYSDVDSIEGGFGSSFNKPVSSEGNHVAFQVNV